jgi:hypothetical protein
MKLDDKFQYGQKNASGELRFVVYHDKERKPYQVSKREDGTAGGTRRSWQGGQHRFIETAIGSAGADAASKVAKQFGFGGTADAVSGLAKNFVGDYLHTFWAEGRGEGEGRAESGQWRSGLKQMIRAI